MVRLFGKRWWLALQVIAVLWATRGGAQGAAPADSALSSVPADCEKMAQLIKQGVLVAVPEQAERCVLERERTDGPKSTAVADVLQELAWVLVDLGDLRRAEQVCLRELTIREAAQGHDHPDVAEALIVHVEVLQQRGTYDAIPAMLGRAYRIQVQALGDRHPRLARTLLNMSHEALRHLDIDAAERHLLRAQDILVSASEVRSDDYRQILIALGELHRHFGSLDRSLPMFEQAERLLREQHGTEHPFYATLLIMMSDVQNRQGNPELALAGLKKGLHVAERTLGSKSRITAGALLSMASVYLALQDLPSAEDCAQRALALFEQLYGNSHRKTAQALNRLAEIRHARYDLASAEALHRRTLAIREALEAPDDPDIADSLHNLAQVLSKRGELDQAELYFRRALAIRERTLGPMSEPLAQTLFALGWLQGRRHAAAQALPLLEQAFSITEAQLRLMSVTLTEARLTALLETLRGQEDVIYSLACAEPEIPGLRRLALRVALLRKGRSVDWATQQSLLTNRLSSDADRSQVERLKALRSRYATLVLSGMPQQASREMPERLRAMKAEASEIESGLASRIAPLRFNLQLPGPAEIVTRVAERLPKGAALIEIVEFTRFEREPAPRATPARHYLALALTSDGEVRIVSLGDAAALDARIAVLLAALQDSSADPTEPCSKVSQLVVQPLASALGGLPTRLFLSPDGALHLIPFAVLGDHHMLIDRAKVSYVSSGRDLLRVRQSKSLSGPALFADPVIGGQDARHASPAPARMSERDLQLQLLARLPGTRIEAEQIAALLPGARLFLGLQATESALLSLVAPSALHIATHGIFLSDQDATAARAQRGFNVQRQPIENPLLRSALVLSGTAVRLNGEAAESADGLATALEVAGMYLFGTRLVVLSACNTGRGIIRSGQGVYGLRRAFVTAGAELLIVSQWKVDDEATKDLMIDFYRRLKSGQSPAEALQAAAQHVRSTRPHPYYWAGFVLIGNGFQSEPIL